MTGNRKFIVTSATVVVALAIGIIPAAIILIIWLWIIQLKNKKTKALDSARRGFDVLIEKNEKQDVP